MAKILGLFLGYRDGNRRLARRATDHFELEAGKGIVGDKRYGKKDRQINILQARFYDWYETSFGRQLLPGSAGENVVVSDELDLNWVNVGARFRFGTALLEIRDFREPCEILAKALSPEDPQPGWFVGHVGILCAVVESGSAVIGDEFELD